MVTPAAALARLGHVRVLANVAERAEEIDVDRARRALERGQEQLLNPSMEPNPLEVLAAVARAQARIDAAQ